jgi:hypothetical protein
MPVPIPLAAGSNTCSARPLDWPLIARGKHSLVFDCGDGWVWKAARGPEQAEAIEALLKIGELLSDRQTIRVPAMRIAAGGYFQQWIRGTHPDDQTTMRLAWLINQEAAPLGLYFRDLVSANIITDKRGTSWIIDALCGPRR